MAKSAEHTRAETGCSPRGQAALPDALSSHSFRATQRMTPVDQCPEPCLSTLQERCPLNLQAEHSPPSGRQPAVREPLCFQD